MADLRDHPRWETTVVAAPAAGANVVVTIPGGFTSVFVSARFTLTTSATVANRVVVLQATDGLNAYAETTSPVAQAASLTRTYSVLRGVVIPSPVGSTIIVPFGTFPIPLDPGHVIQTVVENLQAGDQISSIVIRSLRYPNGPRAFPVPGVETVLEPVGGPILPLPEYYEP